MYSLNVSVMWKLFTFVDQIKRAVLQPPYLAFYYHCLNDNRLRNWAFWLPFGESICLVLLTKKTINCKQLPEVLHFQMVLNGSLIDSTFSLTMAVD